MKELMNHKPITHKAPDYDLKSWKIRSMVRFIKWFTVSNIYPESLLINFAKIYVIMRINIYMINVIQWETLI